jgi:hypothetical protein
MENKNEQILQLLKNGKSYSEIQNLLKVSPGKIAQIKRESALQSTTTMSSSSSSSSDDSTIENSAAYAINSRGYDFIKNSNDPTLILELRKIELDHEEKLVKLKMEEKTREREFENRKSALSNSQYKEDIAQLQNKIMKLEEELYEKSNTEDDVDFINTLYSVEEIESGNFPLSEELSTEFREFIQAFLELEDAILDKEEIQEQIDQIVQLKSKIILVFEEADFDIEESEEKQILDEAQNDLEEFISEIDQSFFKNTVRYSFSKEWKEDLENML